MDFGQLIIAAGVGAVGVMQGMILSQLRDVRKITTDNATSVLKHEITLYGENGDNGLAGDLKDRRRFNRRASDIA